MQTIPGWTNTAVVTTPRATIAVDGTALQADDVSIERSLASGLPGTVLGGSGLTAATGEVTWSQGQDVEERSATPWARRDSLPPSSGARVLVEMGDERGTCRTLTGNVDDSNGSLADNEITSSLVDDIDRLVRPFSLPPLINSMPPLTAGGVSRYIGLSGVWLADRVLRSCGYYATPPASGAVVSATAMGSMWPEVGEVTSCLAPTGGAFPTFPQAPWGQCVQDVDATYAPSTARALNAPMEIMLTCPVGSGNPWVAVSFGAVTLRLALTASVCVVQTMVPTTPVTVASATRGTSTRFVARITPVGADLSIEIRTDGGASATVVVPAPAGLAGALMVSVRAYGAGTARLGPLAVTFPTGAFQALTFTPSALFMVASIAQHALAVIPALDSRQSLNLLKEHAAAIGAALWIDELGRVHWVARDALGAGPIVRTLTSKDDLLDAQWSDEWRDVYSGVDVTWSDVTITRSSRDMVTLWEGGDSVTSGDIVAELLHPGSGEDWVMVDMSITKAGPTVAMDDFNRGIGTFTGAILADGTTQAWADTSLIDTSLRRIDGSTYQITSTVGTVPAGQQARMVAPSEFGHGVWSARFGQRLPVVRGKAKFQTATATTRSLITGPATAAVYTHDGSWFVQTEAQALALADWLATTATVRTPNLTDVDVVFDPRIQLGDPVQLDDPDRSGLRVTGVVFGIRQAVRSGEATTTLTLRVTSVSKLAASLDEYDTVWAGASLDARDVQWAGQSLDAFDTAPLTRS